MREKQGLNPPKLRAALLLAAACLLPSACKDVPSLSLFGPNYKPMTSEVAEIAAPQETGGGKTIYCRASSGAARFGADWKDFRTADFAVPENARASVAFQPARGAGELDIQAWMDMQEQRLLFCPVIDGPPDKKISCASLYALDDDLAAGIKRTFDIPGAVRGGNITCAYDPQALRK